MKTERRMQRGEWLLVQVVASLLVIGLAALVSSRISENEDLLRGHGAVMVAQGQNTGNATEIIFGRDLQRHAYGGAITWAVAIVVLVVIWAGPLFVQAWRSYSSRSRS